MSVRRQPSLLWRILVTLGIVTLTAAACSDPVWEKVEDTVDQLSEKLRAALSD